MTIDWNPRPHVQHAWADANTAYGKISLVLFYTFIWINILMAAWQVVFPLSFGYKCWVDAFVKKEDFQAMMIASMRSSFVLWIGFLAYADVGGYKIKNISMVTVVTTVYVLCLVPMVKVGQTIGCASASCMWMMWLFPAWIVLALVLAMVDDKMTDRGTREENQSLTV